MALPGSEAGLFRGWEVAEGQIAEVGWGESFIAAWVAERLCSSLPGSPHSPFVRRAKGAPKEGTRLAP